mgnify:CR=1 FL=1
MNRVFQIHQTVGDIVAKLPKASEIFKQYKIDFCCGGNRKLSEVVNEQKLDASEILRKLNDAMTESANLNEGVKSFTEMSRSELIEYIEGTHHVYLKKVLPELGDFTTKIMRVHGLRSQELFKVHKLFSVLRAELEQHLMKEEEVLFPLVRQYERNPDMQSLEKVKQVMKETEDEHEAAGDILKELRRITDDYRVPEHGCSTYALTYKMLEELEADLFQHIHLENNILFINLQA